MDTDLVDDILNSVHSTKQFVVQMPLPTTRRRFVGSTPLGSTSDLCKQTAQPMGTEYAEEYRKKDDEEYLKVIWRAA